jgi:hypothetical protein
VRHTFVTTHRSTGGRRLHSAACRCWLSCEGCQQVVIAGQECEDCWEESMEVRHPSCCYCERDQ